LERAYGRLPIRFEPNRGQTDRRVAFLSRGAGYSIVFTRYEIVTRLRQVSWGSQRGQIRVGDSAVLRTRFVGMNPRAAVHGAKRQPGATHYLVGADPRRWRTGLPSYGRVRYERLYPGIDLVAYGTGRELEYDFVVAPGADPHAIAFALDGAESVRLEQTGDLLLKVSGGEVTYHAPVLYQTVAGARHRVEGHYKIASGNRISFAIGKYDRTRPLVIDPVLSYSTYLGGSGFDVPLWSALDRQGNLYISGFTNSADYPVTAGSVEPHFGGGNLDAFVMKLNPDGSGVVYSTYLGGSGNDIATGMSVARDGRAYVVGYTNSVDFPTQNALQPLFAGGSEDGFVAALDASGSRFIYSTYLGGNGDDEPFISPAHPSGTIWVMGYTSSTDFPVTPGAFQTSNAGGYDAFVAQIDRLGRRLRYSTYVGGSGNDFCIDGNVDRKGHALMTGSTNSTDFPVTPGAFQTAFAGGNTDAFVVKVGKRGSSLDYATYLGGSGDEDVRDGRFDDRGNAYVPGFTSSTDFPTTPGAFQRAYGGGASDGYLTVLDPSGSQLVYGTYFGGSGDDIAGGVHPGLDGDVYIVGRTGSTNLPVTADALQKDFGGGTYDSFVARLRFLNSALLYSSYFGGSSNDEANGQGVNLDKQGNLYVVGDTTSADLSTTSGAFQHTTHGSVDGFAYRLSFGSAP
jgi:hypothetical protein